jgi:hypothetical protein
VNTTKNLRVPLQERKVPQGVNSNVTLHISCVTEYLGKLGIAHLHCVLKVAVYCSETFVTIYRIARCNNIAGFDIQLRCGQPRNHVRAVCFQRQQ